METYKTKLLPINEPGKNIPKSILVKVFKIITDDDTGEEKKELDRTIEYFPKTYRSKKGRYIKKEN